MIHLLNFKVMNDFLQHLFLHVQTQARVSESQPQQMLQTALRKPGDLCRLCGKSQQDVTLSSEAFEGCHVPVHFPRTRAESSAGDEGLLRCFAQGEADHCVQTIALLDQTTLRFFAQGMDGLRSLSNNLHLLDFFGGILLGRTDGRIGGCNEGICWRCMKRAVAPSRLVKCVFRRQGP